jgi:sodium-coupled neutral amino acid transporter 7/8
VSLAAGVVMLYKNIVGAGMLSLPFALASAGEVGAVMLVGTGILSGLAFWLLGYMCHLTGADSFASLWRSTVGPKSLWIVNACVVINGVGACTAYMLLVADFLTTHAADVTTSRAAHLAWVALLLLPLAWKRKLTGLTFSSSIGVGAMLYVVGLVVFHPASNAAPTEPLPAASGKATAKMFALSVLTFLAHYNAPKLYNELGYKAFTKTVVVAYSLVICTCLAIGLAGVRRFGSAVAGNVLASFPHTDPWASFGSAAVTLTLFVSYPLVFSSTRDTIDTIFPVREQLWRARVAALVAMTAFFGATLDDIAFVSAVKGGTVGMALSLGFPAIFALRLPVAAATRALAWVMLVASFAGVTCAMIAIFT